MTDPRSYIPAASREALRAEVYQLTDFGAAPIGGDITYLHDCVWRYGSGMTIGEVARHEEARLKRMEGK